MANIYSTLPSTETVLAATAAVPGRTTAPIETGVLGIHDVYASFNPAIRNEIGQVGAKWARTTLNWSEVQKGGLGNHNYDWSNYDAAFADYKAKGIKPLVTIDSLPITANSNWADIDRDFQLFFKEAVNRYKGMGVHYWEIFNEPNLPGYGWPGNVAWSEGRPEDYFGAWVMLLARSAKILRENDPLGVNMNGGISPDGFDPFKAGLYSKYKAQNSFDVFAYHPYGLEGKWSAGIDAIVNQFRVGGDDPNKPIWFNEYGTQDDAARATLVGNSLNEFLANKGRLGGFFLLGMRDSPAGAWGLKTSDGTAKSAWNVVHNYMLNPPVDDSLLTLSQAQVYENSAPGAVIGEFAFHGDEQPALSLVNDAGGRFSLNGTKLVVKSGLLLDHEQALGHELTVRATTSNGVTHDKSFVVSVLDVMNETVVGSSGADRVAGGADADRFLGKLGNDVLYGGAGKDTFAFDTAPNRTSNNDIIVDFNPADDTIHLGKAIYALAGSQGQAIASAAFWIGSAAHDSSDRVIYNSATGAVLYDPDGTGSAQAIQFATIKANLALTASDFVVF